MDKMRVVDVFAIPHQEEIQRVNRGKGDVRRVRCGVRGNDPGAEQMLDQFIHLWLRGQARNSVERTQARFRHRRIAFRSLHLDDFRGKEFVFVSLRFPPFLRRLLIPPPTANPGSAAA